MERKSDLEIYLRTGRRAPGMPQAIEVKFNPNHDEKGRFTFAGQGSASGGANGKRQRAALDGPTPIEKRRAADINRFAASQNAQVSVPITDSITLRMTKRGDAVSGVFTKSALPGSLGFSGTLVEVPGKQELRVVQMKWNASFGSVRSAPDVIRIYSNRFGLFSQINKNLVVHMPVLGTVVNEGIQPQRLDQSSK